MVLVAAQAHVSTSATAAAAAVYFGSRLAHAVVHIAGVSVLMLRTVLFTVGWSAVVVIAVEVLRHAGG